MRCNEHLSYILLISIDQQTQIDKHQYLFITNSFCIKLTLKLHSQFYQQFYVQFKEFILEMSFLESIAYRNAKYQGFAYNNQNDGLGIILDVDFLFCLSNWKQDIPYGPCLIIFPNRDYLLGRIRDKKLQDICSYITSTGDTYFFNFVNGQSNKIAYLEANQSIVELNYQDRRVNPIRSVQKPSDETEARRIVGEILKADVGEEFWGYKSFLRNKIQTQWKDIIQLSESSSLFYAGFKSNTSLGVKFDKKGQIRQIGNFQSFPRNLQFGRKFTEYGAKDIKVEQGIFSQPSEFYQFKNLNRSLQALKVTQRYIKQSTSFLNKFIKLTFFEDLSIYFSQIKREIEPSMVFDYGQRILQNQKIGESEDEHKKSLHFDQVKKDIYNAAQRRKNGRGTSRFSPVKLQAQLFFEKPRKQRIQSPLRKSRQIYLQQSPQKKKSQQKYQYLRQAAPKSPLKPKPIQQREKYRYIQDTLQTTHRPPPAIYSDYALRYREPPQQPVHYERNFDISTNDRKINEMIVNRKINQRYKEDSAFSYKRYNQSNGISPVRKLFDNTNSQSKSPIHFPIQNAQKVSQFFEPQSDERYKHFIDYKNRKKMINEQPSSREQLKYPIYERKVLGPNNLTPQKDKTDRTIQEQGIKDRSKGFRHKKNYNYL